MKILLVDDHAIVRHGIRQLLLGACGGTIFEAATGVEALSVFKNERPDIVVLDLKLPGWSGLELLRRLVDENSTSRIIVLSMYSEPLYVVRALKLGARGYLSKHACADELVTAISRVAAGGFYVEPALTKDPALSGVDFEDPMPDLSNREIEILRLLGEGKTVAEVANALGVVPKTVSNVCSELKAKLGVRRTNDLIRLSQELKIS
jgi:two-component system, NarL family, invasion response regulator UvrY